MAGGAKKGQRFGGRQKGSLNKVTSDLKAMILSALDQAGGVEYLVRQSESNPSCFMTLVGKVLPLQVNGSGKNGEISITITKSEASIV